MSLNRDPDRTSPDGGAESSPAEVPSDPAGVSSDSAEVSVPSHVLVERLPDDESIFLNVETEQYFGLDPIGTAMWKALTETGSVDRALERLQDEFAVDQETLSRDFHALLGRLAERGLVRLENDPRGADPSAEPG